MDVQPILPAPPPNALGLKLRDARQRAHLTQAQLAERVGMPRQKLIQLEQGKPGVAVGAYAAVVAALGLEVTLEPARLRLADYPQLRQIAWNRPQEDRILERDALALYERNWRLIDRDRMPPHERALLERLVEQYGAGILHV
ncbi:MAG: helix-turn-helix transcriptional regulator [Pseudoxanthomonas sp.]